MNSSMLDPLPEEWITSQKKVSLRNSFSQLYNSLLLFKKIDDILEIWVKCQIVQEVLENNQITSNISTKNQEILRLAISTSLLTSQSLHKEELNDFHIASQQAIELWSQLHWESKINRFFLSHKNQLDRISCYYEN